MCSLAIFLLCCLNTEWNCLIAVISFVQVDNNSNVAISVNDLCHCIADCLIFCSLVDMMTTLDEGIDSVSGYFVPNDLKNTFLISSIVFKVSNSDDKFCCIKNDIFN